MLLQLDGNTSSRHSPWNRGPRPLKVLTLSILFGLVFLSGSLAAQTSGTYPSARILGTEAAVHQAGQFIITKGPLALRTALYGTYENNIDTDPIDDSAITEFAAMEDHQESSSFSLLQRTSPTFHTVGIFQKEGWNVSCSARLGNTDTGTLPSSSAVRNDNSSGAPKQYVDWVGTGSGNFVPVNLSSLERENPIFGPNLRTFHRTCEHATQRSFTPTLSPIVGGIPRMTCTAEVPQRSTYNIEDSIESSTVGHHPSMSLAEEQLDVTERYPSQLEDPGTGTVHRSTEILLSNSVSVKSDSTVARYYRSETLALSNKTGFLLEPTISLLHPLLSLQSRVTFLTAYTKKMTLTGNGLSAGSASLLSDIVNPGAITTTNPSTSSAIPAQRTTSNTSIDSVASCSSTCSAGDTHNFTPNATYQTPKFSALNLSKSNLYITGASSPRLPGTELSTLSESMLTNTLNTSTNVGLTTTANTSTALLSDLPNGSMPSRPQSFNSLGTQLGFESISSSGSAPSSLVTVSGVANSSAIHYPESESGLSASLTETNTNPVPTTGGCAQCLPYAGTIMSCDITTSCINVTEKTQDIPVQHYCACRRRFKASGLGNDSSLHFRLPVWGAYDDIVFTAPGVVCNTPCDSHSTTPGEICQEVDLRSDC